MKKRSDTDWKRLESMTDKDIDLSDVLEWFRSHGPGYQTRINHLLRKYMEVNQQHKS